MTQSLSIRHPSARLDIHASQDTLLVYSLPTGGLKQTLSAPRFQIDGHDMVMKLSEVAQKAKPRRLPNGATEYIVGGPVTGGKGLELEIVIRAPARSPIFRFQYRLLSTRIRHLTKNDGTDATEYFTTALTGANDIREVQLSTFDYSQHYFLPKELTLDADLFAARESVMGPIITATSPKGSVLLAYEHGSQTGNRYLEYRLAAGGRVTLVAVKGNYYAGCPIDAAQPYETIWFQVGAVKGDGDLLAATYRNFILRDFALHPAARKPWLFYNSWGLQSMSNLSKTTGDCYSDFLVNTFILDDIDRAHRLGLEVYVLDVGWSDTPGDWTVSPKRLPDNLKAIRDRLQKHGMRLGLWFEPMTVGQSTEMWRRHHDKLLARRDGKQIEPWDVWKTDIGTSFCLASDYADLFADRLIELVREYGVSYFKWDGVNQWCEGDWYTHRCDCDAAGHNHGTDANPPRERGECSQFEQVRTMNRVVEKVQAVCPELIVDLDITEAERCVGLSFLSTGKYFHSNNPLAGQPGHIERSFHVRKAMDFDRWIPQNLFLTHLLPPEGPQPVELNIATLVLGFNGIWGDLTTYSNAQVQTVATWLTRYKEVRDDLATATPVRQGAPGSCPEVYEKLQKNGRGGVILFASHGIHRYVTHRKVARKFWASEGVSVTVDKRGHACIELTVTHEKYGAGAVFFGTT